MNQFNIIKIYKIFTQQQGTNSIQVPIDYKPGDIGTYPGPQNKVQNHEIFVPVLFPWICSSISWFIVYGNLNRIYILLLCENCINPNYVEVSHSAF